ncbi:hypothetical protein [Longimicrobium sp.]|uniref:hypothetical protein n=1 Tax=Longimicrobium sp. TaxID=2029185 RepID=UPI002E305919|nr:hypothetical protein [Longimicrobium sp.]HEX6039636.1 hypothetical protein [Longimicrobium sp.]
MRTKAARERESGAAVPRRRDRGATVGGRWIPPLRALLLQLLAAGGLAAQGRGQGQPAQEGGNLSAQVVDPTAPLKTITVQNRYVPSHWYLDDDENETDLQVAVPFLAFGAGNILRVTIPYRASTPEGRDGLGDVSVFDVVIVPAGGVRLAIGAVASFGTPKGPGVDTYAMGPALGIVVPAGRWTAGVFNQNLFSGDDIATSQLQPVLAYTVDEHLSLALGDLQYTVDWNEGRFVNVPLGLQVNYVTALARQPLRLFVNPQYNLRDEPGSRKWTLTAGVALIAR